MRGNRLHHIRYVVDLRIWWGAHVTADGGRSLCRMAAAIPRCVTAWLTHHGSSGDARIGYDGKYKKATSICLHTSETTHYSHTPTRKAPAAALLSSHVTIQVNTVICLVEVKWRASCPEPPCLGHHMHHQFFLLLLLVFCKPKRIFLMVLIWVRGYFVYLRMSR